MKKFIITEEERKSILSVLKKLSINESDKSFEATANVEDDMLMSFPVKGFRVVNGKVVMFLTENARGALSPMLYVVNFSGPIYDTNTKQKVYQSSSFDNISDKNYMQIAKSYGIPIKS